MFYQPVSSIHSGGLSTNIVRFNTRNNREGRFIWIFMCLRETEPFPVIVWFHSCGAWKTLNKSYVEQGVIDQVKRSYCLSQRRLFVSMRESGPHSFWRREQLSAAQDASGMSII